jgi:serine O-acetyltransferase
MSEIYRVPANFTDRVTNRAVMLQKLPVVGPFFRAVLKLKGIDIPPHALKHAQNLILRHSGNVVVHYMTRLGCNVTIHQGVTIGRGDIWNAPSPDFRGFEIRDEAILCANAVVVNSNGVLIVGEGTVVGANSVLTQSTGQWEIWAGVPAKKIGVRVDPRYGTR